MLERPEPAEGGLPQPAPTPYLQERVSDVERTRVIDDLRHHCGEGTLTLDEFSDRVGQVYDARTRADLALVTRDLPSVSVPPPLESRRKKAVRWTVAVMSGSSRKGRWRPAEHTTAVAVMGGCDLDLRGAEIDGPEVTITAIAVMGRVDIIVPEGIQVEMDGFAFMGSKEARLGHERPIPGAPVVRVRAFALMGGVTVKTRRARPTRVP